MEVAEHNGYRQEQDVARVPNQESHKLHHLGKGEHEDDLSPEGVSAVRRIPTISRPPARGQQERVGYEGEGSESGKMQGIGAPWLLAVK